MNKIILITGCSSGFGMLTAARLAAGGHTIYATMRNLHKQDTLKQELAKRETECQILYLDVTDDISINKVIKTIEKQAGRLDVLINNAGYGIGGFLVENSLFDFAAVTRNALPLMRVTAAKSNKEFSTKIINISSAQGRSTLPGLGAYGASKFALEGFSESLFFELHPFGIEVVILEPGTYSTKAIDENSQEADAGQKAGSPYANYTKRLKELHSNILITKKGVGDPEDVAIMIEEIINRGKNKLRYLAGTQAKIRIWIRTILPFSWFSKIILKFVMGISKRK